MKLLPEWMRYSRRWAMPIKVPKGWQLSKLRDHIFEKRVRIKKATQGVVVVSVSNQFGIRDSKNTFGRQVHSEDIGNYKKIQQGWFAYNPSRINVGSIAKHDEKFIGALSPMYVVFEVNSEFLTIDYASQFIESERFQQRVKCNLQGSVRQALTFDALQSFPFALPTKQEQGAIVHALKQFDRVIEQALGNEARLTKAKFDLMRNILTCGYKGNAPFKPIPQKWILGRVAENLTQIPADWSLVRLTSVAKLESGHTPSRKKPEYWIDGNIPWISLQDAHGLDSIQISATNECINQLGIDNSSARLLPKDTVVLQRTANIGLSSRMGRPMCTSQHFANWVCGDKLHPGYLVQVFKHMKREWKRLQAGSVLPDIYMTTFKKLQILLPPIEEQIKIAEIGEAFDLRIEAETAYLTELKKTKQALAQELLSGRVRLPQSMIDRFKESEEISESAA